MYAPPPAASQDRSAEHERQFRELYESWGVFDLFQDTIDQLEPDWLVIFNIARKLLNDKPLAGMELPESLITLINGKIYEDYEQTSVTEVSLRESTLPIEAMLIRNNRRLSEIARALPGQLLFLR